MQKPLVVLAVLTSLLYAPASHAQYMSMFNAANTSAVNFAGTVSVNSAIGRSAKISTKKKRRKTAKRTANWFTPSKRKVAYQPIAYSTQRAIRSEVIASYISRVRRSDPSGAAQLEQLFRDRDLFGEFAQNARAYGLDIRDFGDVLTAYWAVNWGAVHKIGRPSRAQVQGLRRQFRAILAGSQLTQRTTLAARQRIADDMMVNLIIVDGAVQDSLRRQSHRDLQRLSEAIQQTTLNTMNINLKALKLTTRGLQP